MAYQKLQASKAVVVVKSDTVNIPNPSSPDGIENSGNVLYVGTGGTLKVRTVGGDDVTFVNVPNGTFIPVQVVRVFATGTGASNILALW